MKELKRFVQGVNRARHIAFSREYDETVDPDEYEKHVIFVDNREKLSSRLVSDSVRPYVPLMDTSGEKSEMLDIAAGTGLVSRALSDSGYRVTATDISSRALAYLSNKNPEIRTMVADMNEELPFKSNIFAGVTTLWGNRFIKDADAFADEVHRVLAPKGTFIWPVFIAEIPIWKVKSGMLHPTTPFALTQVLRDHGFGNIKLSPAPRIEYLFKEKIPPHNIPIYITAQKGVIDDSSNTVFAREPLPSLA